MERCKSGSGSNGLRAGNFTAAYAGVKMYRMYVEKQGDYSVKTGITSENKLADLPVQIHDIDFKTGYIRMA